MNAFADPRNVRRTVGVLAAVAGLALAAFTVLNQPLVGVGVYAVAMVGVVAVQFRADTTVFDERDEAIAEEAAQLTLTVFGWASAVVFPALTLAWGLGHFEWGPGARAIAFGVAALYLTYAGLLFAVRRRR
ncbi:DUF2178 family protein [Halobacterium hubeiense]|uniref:DUF2178 family protein n=1 Tax=Halobacterium hubeiense TaxID=1407499 RepID=A0A0U5H5P6_9EURY|nr:DUF2178 domain-containing protein [Halobacterium hubeiense]CQH62288.1 DUF2178 family protein [Halobacterium hubeiense]